MSAKIEKGDLVKLANGVAEREKIFPFNVNEVTEDGLYGAHYMKGSTPDYKLFSEDQLELVRKN